MAPQQPGERHPAAGPQPESCERFVGVLRAGRDVPAMQPDQRREGDLINFDQRACTLAGSAPDGASEPSCAPRHVLAGMDHDRGQ